jgi:hypothetical protein
MIYTKDKNTYFAKPKDDDKDRIELEIGDSKQADFYPQMKIMRWDNEANVSIRLKTDETAVPSKSGEKISWETDKLKAEFYALENGHEFEIILKEKPLTNRIEFTLETKGLDFFYQPFLKNQNPDGSFWEENERGDISGCPENVGGSYAVYTSENKVNYVGGKEYKCGKVGHIFRPKIIDAEGTEVWGSLLIENGILSVTIPQDFLDKAVYPVRHAAGLTFGYETIGASTDMQTLGNAIYNGNGFQTGGSPGTLSTIKIACWYTEANKQTRMAVYTNTGGTPPASGAVPDTLVPNSDTGGIIVTRATKPTQVSEWTSGAVTGTVSANTYYWLANDNEEDLNVAYDSGPNYSYRYHSLGYSSFPPATAAPDYAVAAINSIYATYTASGGGAVIPPKPNLLTLGVG